MTKPKINHMSLAYEDVKLKVQSREKTGIGSKKLLFTASKCAYIQATKRWTYDTGVRERI